MADGMGGHQSASMGKDEWLTPPHVLAALGAFDLDPCSPITPPWPIAARSYHELGLIRPWTGRVWCNPPYGAQTGEWLDKCATHGNALALIFARTETEDWQRHVWPRAHGVLFLAGRLFFHHVDGTRGKHNGGAPSALIAYGENNAATLATCGLPGRFVRLKGRCDFTRGIVLAAAEMARYEGTASTHVRTLISAAGGERACVEHGDAEDLAELRTVGAIAL